MEKLLLKLILVSNSNLKEGLGSIEEWFEKDNQDREDFNWSLFWRELRGWNKSGYELKMELVNKFGSNMIEFKED